MINLVEGVYWFKWMMQGSLQMSLQLWPGILSTDVCLSEAGEGEEEEEGGTWMKGIHPSFQSS